LLQLAYSNIKSKPSHTSPSLQEEEETQGISYEVFELIANQLKNESFQFKSRRKIGKPEPPKEE
jgi:hypothetical protein